MPRTKNSKELQQMNLFEESTKESEPVKRGRKPKVVEPVVEEVEKPKRGRKPGDYTKTVSREYVEDQLRKLIHVECVSVPTDITSEALTKTINKTITKFSKDYVFKELKTLHITMENIQLMFIFITK